MRQAPSILRLPQNKSAQDAGHERQLRAFSPIESDPAPAGSAARLPRLVAQE
jgi:hypothetical protein